MMGSLKRLLLAGCGCALVANSNATDFADTLAYFDPDRAFAVLLKSQTSPRDSRVISLAQTDRAWVKRKSLVTGVGTRTKTGK